MRVYLFLILLSLMSCNALKTLTNGDTDLSEEFFQGGNVQSLYDGLVSFWRFDETGSTSTRSDVNGLNDLIHNIGAIASAGGKRGNSINCTSIDTGNRFSLNSSNGMGFGNNTDFSISFWIYLMSFNAGDKIADFSSGFNISLSGSSDITFWANSTTTSTTIATGSWNHYVFSVQRSTGVSIFRNGVFQGYTPNVTNGQNYLDSTFSICSDIAWIPNVDANIDSFGIWNRNLSQEEINALYNGKNDLD